MRGLDAIELKKHWLIGKSDKRDLAKLPMGRQQIGKFGIGKLATYVLANRLTHISKKQSKYYSTSMNFKTVDDRGDEEIEPRSPIKISLRELTEVEAKEALKDWIEATAFKKSGLKMFGVGAPHAWTFAILSDLKDKIHEIRRGRLEWVLRTALPLRDDFSIFLDGTKLAPSKAGKGRLKKWILGKDIIALPKPAPDEIEANEDKNQALDTETRFALEHSAVGRITGYAEVYRDWVNPTNWDEVMVFSCTCLDALSMPKTDTSASPPMNSGTALLDGSAWSSTWTHWTSISNRIGSEFAKAQC